VKIDDSQLYAILAGMLDGRASVQVTPASSSGHAYSITTELEVHDNHRGDSPDAVLHLRIIIDHPLLPKLSLHIPLVVEGEKAGIGAALDDLRKFAERKHFLQTLPMLVVGGAGNPARRSEQVLLPAKVEIVQIPYRALSL
jgi:hypothetical protein